MKGLRNLTISFSFKEDLNNIVNIYEVCRSLRTLRIDGQVVSDEDRIKFVSDMI
jgi:hypothetical protein